MISKIPGLNLGGNTDEKQQPAFIQQEVSFAAKPTQSKAQSMQLGLPIGGLGKVAGKPGGSLGFGIDLSKLGNKQDYQDEFMAKYDEFSESWRNLLKKD